MKFFLRFFGVIAVIIAIAFGIFWVKVYGPGAAERLENSLQATNIEEDRNAPPPSSSQPEVRKNFHVIAEMAARQVGAELVRFGDTGTAQDVMLSWKGSNSQKGADFLEQLIRTGNLRDFEEPSPAQVTKDRRGDTTYTATYRLYMQ